MKQTSISAYRDITDSGRKATHSERIYAAMLKHGAGTYEQIATYADMQDRQVWKRLSELERDGKIRDSGRTSVLSSGKHGTIWEAVPMWGTGNESNDNQINSGFLSQINDAFKRTNEQVSNAKPKDIISFSIADFNQLIYDNDQTKILSHGFEIPRAMHNTSLLEGLQKQFERDDAFRKEKPYWDRYMYMPNIPSNVLQTVFSRQELMGVVNTAIVPLLTKKKQRNVPIPETTTFKRWIQLDLFRDN